MALHDFALSLGTLYCMRTKSVLLEDVRPGGTEMVVPAEVSLEHTVLNRLASRLHMAMQAKTILLSPS